ncbi:MAG TPA: hypothetical protein VF868_15265 [Bacteroidia bacterium]|jgi:ribosomal protein S24E
MKEPEMIYVNNKKLKKVERILFNYLIKRDKERLAKEKEEQEKSNDK